MNLVKSKNNKSILRKVNKINKQGTVFINGNLMIGYNYHYDITYMERLLLIVVRNSFINY